VRIANAQVLHIDLTHRVAVLFVGVAPEEMPVLARSCRIEAQSGGQVLHFKQPGGKEAEVPSIQKRQ